MVTWLKVRLLTLTSACAPIYSGHWFQDHPGGHFYESLASGCEVEMGETATSASGDGIAKAAHVEPEAHLHTPGREEGGIWSHQAAWAGAGCSHW